MEKEQVVTISFFQYPTIADQWWAFKLMGQSLSSLESVKGLSFVKMLGSGGGNGFSIWPNFSTYGLLGVWENEQMAKAYFDKHHINRECRSRAKYWWTVYMKTASFHGLWDGVSPFNTTVDFDKKKLVAVITRASIASRKLWQFWRYVPRVGRAADKMPGLLFSVGVGELPIVQQATFSIWENSKFMMDYAYESKYHKEVVKKTRTLGWYTEELFARFHPYHTEGNWHAVDHKVQSLL